MISQPCAVNANAIEYFKLSMHNLYALLPPYAILDYATDLPQGTLITNSYAIDMPWPCYERDTNNLGLPKFGAVGAWVISVGLGMDWLSSHWICAIMRM